MALMHQNSFYTEKNYKKIFYPFNGNKIGLINDMFFINLLFTYCTIFKLKSPKLQI